MNIIIWGAGKGNIEALELCKNFGWNVLAIVDSDEDKVGAEIESHKIFLPNYIDSVNEDYCILMGTINEEAYNQAKKYTSNVIKFEVIKKVQRGTDVMPRYFEKNLEKINIKNARLLTDRLELLSKIHDLYNGSEINFAEIGVAYGDFSKEIFKICNPVRLYLVDAWESERYSHGKKLIEEMFDEEINMGKVILKQGYSTDVLAQMEDNMLDVVYIDTAHSYQLTWDELVLCDKKVKNGGIISGHDYVHLNHESRLYYGVIEAVNKFCLEYDYEIIYLTLETVDMWSFALRKL